MAYAATHNWSKPAIAITTSILPNAAKYPAALDETANAVAETSTPWVIMFV
jgi:hypothetical protein